MVLATAFFLSTRIENALWWGTSVYTKLLLFLIPCFFQSEDSNEASFLRVLTLIDDMYRWKINKKCIYLQSLMAFPMLTYLLTMGAQRFSANN